MRILNEKEYAEKLLFAKKPLDKISFGELVILAKYYRFLGEQDGDAVREKVIAFCKDNILEFNAILSMDRINAAIRGSARHRLRLPIDVPITKKELESIISIRNYRYEKVLFVMLVLSKYYKMTNTKIIRVAKDGTPGRLPSKAYYLGRMKNSTIFGLARVAERENENIMHILYSQGKIDHDLRANSYFIKFSNTDSLNDEIAFAVTDMNKIVDFYYPHCIDCGKIVEKPNQLRCPECKIKEQRRLSREGMKKIRKLSKC